MHIIFLHLSLAVPSTAILVAWAWAKNLNCTYFHGDSNRSWRVTYSRLQGCMLSILCLTLAMLTFVRMRIHKYLSYFVSWPEITCILRNHKPASQNIFDYTMPTLPHHALVTSFSISMLLFLRCIFIIRSSLELQQIICTSSSARSNIEDSGAPERYGVGVTITSTGVARPAIRLMCAVNYTGYTLIL